MRALGKEVALQDGQGRFAYRLGLNAADVTIAIRNAAGSTVFSTEGQTEAGKHTFEWDGRTFSGATAPDGAYTVVIGAIDRKENILDVEQSVFGRVTGAGAEDGEVTLFMGDVGVTMDKVLSVVETKQPQEE